MFVHVPIHSFMFPAGSLSLPFKQCVLFQRKVPDQTEIEEMGACSHDSAFSSLYDFGQVILPVCALVSYLQTGENAGLVCLSMMLGRPKMGSIL